jgi:hypothetical protein
MVREGGFHPERRSAQRFLISLPVETDRGPGVTRDVSTSGLYLVTEHPFLVAGQQLMVGDHLHLTMDVPDPDHPKSPLPLRLSLKGRVVRIERSEADVGMGIALDAGSRYLVQAS